MNKRHRPPPSSTQRRRLAVLLVLLLAGALPAGAQVPVLAYHGFAAEPEGRGSLTESYARFEQMLRFLADHDLRSAFPDEIGRGEADPSRSVILTFDDGLREHLRAAEILERYGFRGIFFVIPARVADNDERHLSAGDLRRLARAGHRIAVHGYRHRSLVTSGSETAASIVRSGDLLRARLPRGHPIHDFAFPFGHYSDEIVEAAGERYRYLHTVNPGYWDGTSPLVPRMLLANDVPLSFYQAYVRGGSHYRPAAALIGADGSSGDTLRFHLSRTLPEGELGMLAISADREGTLYNLHPLGENARVAGRVITVDLRAHLARHYPLERRVISYALVTRTPAGVRYLTPGYSHWIP